MMQPENLQPRDKIAVPSAKASRFRKGRLAGTLIAAGSAAIVSVYSIGYAKTEPAAEQFAVAPPPAASATVSAPTATPQLQQAPGGFTRPPVVWPTPTPAQTSGQAVSYRDGSHIGSGTSRHGGMQVTVVIAGGKITSANVTACNTRYPCSDVAPLVSAAVANQGVPVNHVSGATDSSNAYKQAVTSALSQARLLG